MTNTYAQTLDPQYSTKHTLTFAGLIIWFCTVLWFSLTGAYIVPEGQPPLFLVLSISIPVLTFAIAYNFSSSFKHYVLNLDIRTLILLHSWRMLGFGFLFIYAFSQLPLMFALPAGIGDAIAAIFATVIGISFIINKHGVKKKWISVWNSFGLMDFVIAVSMGLITRTGNIGHLENTVASDAMSHFPLVMIPGFIVPFYLLTHIIIILQLRTRFKNSTLIKLD
jgi:hypothetical protein